MIIWRGMGFLVAVLVAAVMFGAQYATKQSFGDAYWQDKAWPAAAALGGALREGQQGVDAELAGVELPHEVTVAHLPDLGLAGGRALGRGGSEGEQAQHRQTVAMSGASSAFIPTTL